MASQQGTGEWTVSVLILDPHAGVAELSAVSPLVCSVRMSLSLSLLWLRSLICRTEEVILPLVEFCRE